MKDLLNKYFPVKMQGRKYGFASIEPDIDINEETRKQVEKMLEELKERIDGLDRYYPDYNVDFRSKISAYMKRSKTGNFINLQDLKDLLK